LTRSAKPLKKGKFRRLLGKRGGKTGEAKKKKKKTKKNKKKLRGGGGGGETQKYPKKKRERPMGRKETREVMTSSDQLGKKGGGIWEGGVGFFR